MNLGGWARIGVVASVIWFLAGGIVGNNIAIGDAGRTTQLWFDGCVAANKRQLGEYGPYEKVWTPCWNEHGAQFAKNVEGHWFVALAFALIPIPIAWLLGWLAISCTRWIVRGFAKVARFIQIEG